jgi:hypothetical protein
MRSSAYLLLLIVVVSCQQPGRIPDNFDYGKIEDNVYKNQYFHFQLPVPETWVVQNKEQTEKLVKEGKEYIQQHNKEMEKTIKAGDVSTATLLTVFKNKTDSVTGEFNPSLMVIAENLGSGSGVRSGKDYLISAKKLMEKSGIPYRFSNEFQVDKIGNRKFDVMPVSVTSGGIGVNQFYYTTIEKNFALSMIISFSGDVQKNQLVSIIDKIKFD